MKTCTRCGLLKTVDSFYKDGAALRAECKHCTLKVRAAHYDKNAEVVKAKGKQRYAAGGLVKRHVMEQGVPGAAVQTCSSCAKTKPLTAFLKKSLNGPCRKCVSNAYPRDAEKQRAKGEKYFKAHHAELLIRAKKYRADNLDIIQARDRARRPQKRVSDRLYYSMHPEKRAARNATYHHRSRTAAGKLTAAQVKARFEVYGNCCAYCGSGQHITADHVIPLSRGGSNLPANIRPACRPCNSSKGAKKLSEWLAQKAA